MRGIQYSALSMFIRGIRDDWIVRWSLSSGGAWRRPGGRRQQ
jgi:hypothetical protein